MSNCSLVEQPFCWIYNLFIWNEVFAMWSEYLLASKYSFLFIWFSIFHIVVLTWWWMKVILKRWIKKRITWGFRIGWQTARICSLNEVRGAQGTVHMCSRQVSQWAFYLDDTYVVGKVSLRPFERHFNHLCSPSSLWIESCRQTDEQSGDIRLPMFSYSSLKIVND